MSKVIDQAVAEIIRRLASCDAPMKVIAERAGVGFGTIWNLRQIRSAEEAGVTTTILRRVESALDELDRERSAGGAADDPEHPVPPHSRKQMAACHE